jgi:hypothetical protein
MSNNADNHLGSNQIPEQTVGSEINARSEVSFDNPIDVHSYYEVVKGRLLDVNSWCLYAKLPVTSFKLFDEKCRVAERLVQEKDFIRIDIPGPGPKTGQGYDWVVVESIVEESDEEGLVISMTVRPTAHPLSDDPHTAHFLSDVSSATFQVKQSGNTVAAEQHGRNEVPNRDTAHTFDNVRNTMVGWGSKLGLSFPQWKGLVKGLVKK